MVTDRETELLQMVWRRAFREGDVMLNLPTESDVTNVRFKLYNVAKMAKRRPAGTDYELEDAVGNCSISVDKAAKTIRVYRKDKSLLLQSIASQLGETLTAPKGLTADDEAAAAEAFKRAMEVQEKLAQSPEAQRPFNYPIRHKKD